jgi:hypothetical protein
MKVTKKKRPAKLEGVLLLIRKNAEEGNYTSTLHSGERQGERKITILEALSILRNGYREESKDEFKTEYSAWNYAMRGKTIDARELRVVVSFDAEGMLIITAIELGVGNGKKNR